MLFMNFNPEQYTKSGERNGYTNRYTGKIQ